MSKAVNRGQGRRSWRLLDALLRFRAFEAIRYREFRLIWFGQVFTTMATWMDQVARGLLSVHSRCNLATRSPTKAERDFPQYTEGHPMDRDSHSSGHTYLANLTCFGSPFSVVYNEETASHRLCH